MALTVVSMARTLVASAVSKAASAADEASQLLGVQKEIWYVRPAILFLPHSVTPQSPPPLWIGAYDLVEYDRCAEPTPGKNLEKLR